MWGVVGGKSVSWHCGGNDSVQVHLFKTSSVLVILGGGMESDQYYSVQVTCMWLNHPPHEENLFTGSGGNLFCSRNLQTWRLLVVEWWSLRVYKSSFTLGTVGVQLFQCGVILSDSVLICFQDGCFMIEKSGFWLIVFSCWIHLGNYLVIIYV